MSTLDGASVLVVGAAGGLGSPIAHALDHAGARLTLTSRSPNRLGALGLPGEQVLVDLRQPGAAETAVAAAVQAHGSLDGLVYAAGVVGFGAIGEVDDHALVRLFTLNTLAPIRVLRAALPHLQAAAGNGREPFAAMLSAVVAEQPMVGMAAYSASKAALTAFDAAAARELRRQGIRLIDVRPPHTETGLAERPICGRPPRLPQGLAPRAVADRIVQAILAGERDLPAAAFG